jgi:predicted component of type VI protein secretion system
MQALFTQRAVAVQQTHSLLVAVYVSIRQHTSAHVSIRQRAVAVDQTHSLLVLVYRYMRPCAGRI